MLIISGCMLGVGFWLWLYPVTKAMAPDFDPYRSPAGFWHDKEHALRMGWWRHDDGLITGYFGGKEWVEKIIGWLRDGRDFTDCASGHRDGALALITNHNVPTVEDQSTAWLGWWELNRNRTQEEWIQAGFAENDIPIALPPSPNDWPRLLTILGAVAGPKLSRGGKAEQEFVFPAHLRYNAYRWLRDSGFDPVKYAVFERATTLTGEHLGGLLEYRVQERALFQPPLPGRLAFALPEKWGLLGYPDSEGLKKARWSQKPLGQILFTGFCLLLIGVGWRLRSIG